MVGSKKNLEKQIILDLRFVLSYKWRKTKFHLWSSLHWKERLLRRFWWIRQDYYYDKSWALCVSVIFLELIKWCVFGAEKFEGAGKMWDTQWAVQTPQVVMPLEHEDLTFSSFFLHTSLARVSWGAKKGFCTWCVFLCRLKGVNITVGDYY